MSYFKPYPKEFHSLSDQIANFGLWYNKFAPSWGEGENGWDCMSKKDYFKKAEGQYQKIKAASSDFLKYKQKQQAECALSFNNYRVLTIQAKLVSPMICGIGNSHATENGLSFDRNSGMPVIPASTLKGLTRLAYIRYLATEGSYKDKNVMETSSIDTYIWKYFGGELGEGESVQSYRGELVFFDSLPIRPPPSMKTDILNPHYPDYYQKGREPTDNQNPIPVTYLCVDEGAEYIFRVLIPSSYTEEQYLLIKKILSNALSSGIGAKSSLGLGRFGALEYGEPLLIQSDIQKEKQEEDLKKLERLSPEDQAQYKIKQLKKDTQLISLLVTELSASSFSAQTFVLLKGKLIELEEWKPDGSKQKKEKMKLRNDLIEERIQKG